MPDGQKTPNLRQNGRPPTTSRSTPIRKGHQRPAVRAPRRRHRQLPVGCHKLIGQCSSFSPQMCTILAMIHRSGLLAERVRILARRRFAVGAEPSTSLGSATETKLDHWGVIPVWIDRIISTLSILREKWVSRLATPGARRAPRAVIECDTQPRWASRRSESGRAATIATTTGMVAADIRALDSCWLL